MPDDLDIRRRRAAWRATHRGTRELDLLIGGYAQSKLAAMTDADLAEFEAFLARPDSELQQCLLAPEAAEEGAHDGLVRAIRAFHGLHR